MRFRLEVAPIITHACHCRLCQRLSGAPFRAVAMIENDRVTVLEGETRSFHGTGSQKQLQCAACGCVLWTYHPTMGDAVAFVGVGMLDQPERLPPEAHYFIRSKHPWIALPAGIPAFETHGDPGKAGAKERIMAVFAANGVVPQQGDWGRETPASVTVR